MVNILIKENTSDVQAAKIKTNKLLGSSYNFAMEIIFYEK